MILVTARAEKNKAKVNVHFKLMRKHKNIHNTFLT